MELTEVITIIKRENTYNSPGFCSQIVDGDNNRTHLYLRSRNVCFPGQHQMAYGSPAPGPRTDLHRYVILMWEHAGRRISVPKPSSRAKFNVKQFIEKNKLGDPIAGNFFLAQHEG